jgi:hypothetical protein
MERLLTMAVQSDGAVAAGFLSAVNDSTRRFFHAFDRRFHGEFADVSSD